MSEAMTNREIEDVLTSIRRLVAQDSARPVGRPPEAKAPVERLILTESQRVAPPVGAAPAPVSPVPVEPPAPEPVFAADLDLPAPDFSRLEATIAELEAAVSANGGGWEGEASDGAPKVSNVTELYGRVAFSHRAATDVPDSADEVGAQGASPAQSEELASDDAMRESATVENGAPEDDAILDEEMLRAVVAQIVREELHGQLGERITAQVRKLVRAEIAKALDERRML